MSTPFERDFQIEYDRAVRARRLLYPDYVPPEQPSPFRRNIQGAASDLTLGLIPPARNKRFPPLDRESFTPEQQATFEGMDPVTRMRAMMERPEEMVEFMASDRFDELIAASENRAGMPIPKPAPKCSNLPAGNRLVETTAEGGPKNRLVLCAHRFV